jgi:hypothetical protein
MDALYPLSRSKDLQQNSLHPELGISLEELGNEKDGMEAVADWPRTSFDILQSSPVGRRW